LHWFDESAAKTLRLVRFKSDTDRHIVRVEGSFNETFQMLLGVDIKTCKADKYYLFHLKVH
jgi:hypothetical protein